MPDGATLSVAAAGWLGPYALWYRERPGGAMNHVICKAIANRQLLRLSYSGWNRVVEPHAYGLGRGRREMIRAWQVEDCVSCDGRLGWHLDPAGWKLLRVDEIRLLSLLPEPLPEPRPDYRRGDKDIWLIFCQL